MQPYGSARTSFGDAREPVGGGRSVPLDLKRLAWGRSRARRGAAASMAEGLHDLGPDDAQATCEEERADAEHECRDWARLSSSPDGALVVDLYQSEPR